MRSLTRIGITAALAAGVLTAGVTNHQVSGFQSEVSCLSSRLCVLDGYNNDGVGDVVAVRHGVPGRVSTIKHTSGMYGVSCPGLSGCVALGRPSNDVGALFVKISDSGAVTGSKLVTVPPGVTISSIDCAGLTNCTVAGTDFFTIPAGIEVGTWNGSKLSLHLVKSPKGSSSAYIGGISCWGSSCLVAGYVDKGTGALGLILPVHHGQPGKLRTVKNDFFYSIACASATRCYASGFAAHGAGVIVPLSNGIAGKAIALSPADTFGIACGAGTCTAVGEELAPPSSGDTYWGVLVSLSAGKVTGISTDSAVGGFDGSGNVARVGRFFAAIGPAQRAGSEVVTG
jgi:hypothetical protein